MQKRFVYLDHAAATPLDPAVREAMMPFLDGEFGNPSAIHQWGRRAKEAVEAARRKVADVFQCGSDEVIFTGSGTESDNLAIFGTLRQAQGDKGVAQDDRQHIVTSVIEHSAVLNAVKAIGNAAFVKVGSDGIVDPRTIKDALTEATTLVSIIYANNEIGTIQPIKEITKVVRDWKKDHGRGPNDAPFTHTDACQAAGYLEVDVRKLNIDLLTINGSKIYGPKGVGALFVRRGAKLAPILHGGGQERGLRPGTENVAAIVGLGEALARAHAEREAETVRLIKLRDEFVRRLLAEIPDVTLNGHPTNRLPNNVNVTIRGVEGEALLLYLDAAGIACSTGSSCHEGSVETSHVITALGRSRADAESTVRFTLGRSTTSDDIAYVMDNLPEVVRKLRAVSNYAKTPRKS